GHRNLTSVNLPAVEGGDVLAILLDDSTIEGETAKQPFGARIRQYLSIKFHICISGCITPDRAGSGGRIGADSELIADELFHTMAVHDQHYKIYSFESELQAKAAAFDCKERWGRPASVTLAAHNDALTITTTDADAAL